MIKKYAKPLFAVYALIMLFLLFWRSGGEPGVPYWEQVAARCNLIPFELTSHFLHLLTISKYRLHAIVNLAGNVLMFVPLGLFLPMVFPRLAKLWRTCLAALVIMYVVETLQLFTLLGFFDVDDLILNLVGTALGYGIYRLICPKLK